MAKTVNIKMTYHSSSDIENMIVETIDKYYQGGMLYKGTIVSIDDLPLTYKEGYTYTMIDGENSYLVIANVTRDYEGDYDPTHWQIVLSSGTGEVTADKVYLKDDIRLSGTYTTIGNLDKNAADSTLEEGQSLQEVLEEMLSKELNPIAVNPTGSITITNTDTSVEVGTEIAISYEFTFNKGRFKYDDDTSVECELPSDVEYLIDGVKVDKVGTLSTFTTEDNTTYKVTGNIRYPESKPGVTKPNGNETEVTVSDGILTVTSTNSITTYRNMFFYCGKKTNIDLDTLDSDSIRTSEFWNAKPVTSTLSVPGQSFELGEGAIFLAIPTTKSVTAFSQSDGTMASAIELADFPIVKTVGVYGANNGLKIDYNVYMYNPSTLASSDVTYKITIE